MKKFLFTIALLSSISVPTFADSIDEMFRGGNNDEFEFEDPFSKANVLRAIAHDAGVACRGGVCTISSTDTKWRTFDINLNSGIGRPSYGNTGGTSIFLGEGAFGGSNGNYGSDSEYGNHSVNLSVSVGSCTQKVNIPRSLYYSLNTYLYGLNNTDGTVRRSFTPADEAMIIFYTTVSKQIGSGSCRNGGGR